MSELRIAGARVLLDQKWVETDLGVRNGMLVDPETLGSDAPVHEAAGLLAAPGYVDLQCNGGLGIDLAREPERLWELAALLPRFGVTAWLPTIVAAPEGIVDRAVAALASGPPPGWAGAVPVGLHLEGPFLSPAKKGAHPQGLLRAPSIEGIAGWSKEAGVALVTLAPDLAGSIEVLAALVERGVVVSLGHTPATFAQATAAVDAGARWVTHLFNAMAPLHHREPGLAGAALTDERLHVGLIPDGIHVHPKVVAMAQRALGDRLTIVTDAVGALGMPYGRHSIGRAEVTIDDTGVRLADGTLAGSNLPMDQGVRNLMTYSGCTPDVAVRAASGSPARLLGDPSRGTLAPGGRADVVLLTETLDLLTTFVGGVVLHGG